MGLILNLSLLITCAGIIETGAFRKAQRDAGGGCIVHTVGGCHYLEFLAVSKEGKEEFA